MELNIKLRIGEPKDAICIGALSSQVFLDTYATEGIRQDLALEAKEAGDVGVIQKSIASGASHFILAERNGHLLGFAECRNTDPPYELQITAGIELCRLYVQRHAHRTGTGSALIKSVESYAETRGAKQIWLTVWDGNDKAKLFYAAHHYVDMGGTEYEFEGNRYQNRVYCKIIRKHLT